MWRVWLMGIFVSAAAIADESVMMRGTELARGIAGGIPGKHVDLDAALAGDQIERQLNEAMDSYVGDFCDPRRPNILCQRRYNNRAWRIAGARACYERNRDEAIKAWNRLGQMDRQFVKYICNRNGIEIP